VFTRRPPREKRKKKDRKKAARSVRSENRLAPAVVFWRSIFVVQYVVRWIACCRGGSRVYKYVDMKVGTTSASDTRVAGRDGSQGGFRFGSPVYPTMGLPAIRYIVPYDMHQRYQM
jgi:hypothetical protein